MSKLAERAYVQVMDAKQLKERIMELARVEESKQEPDLTVSYLLDWHTTAITAVRLCVLACDLLPQTELTALKRRIDAEERGLWNEYTLAEWLDDDEWFDIHFASLDTPIER